MKQINPSWFVLSSLLCLQPFSSANALPLHQSCSNIQNLSHTQTCIGQPGANPALRTEDKTVFKVFKQFFTSPNLPYS